MALINQNGNYLRITNIRFDNNSIEYQVYRNQQIREDEKNGVVSQYEVINRGVWNTDVLPEIVFTAIPPTNKGILDGLKTLCYQKMIEDESAFGNWHSDEE